MILQRVDFVQTIQNSNIFRKYCIDRNILQKIICTLFFLQKWRIPALSVRLVIPLFWTSGNVYPGYQRVACMQWIPQITSGAIPTDLLVTSMGTKSFLIHVLAHIQALVGLQCGIELVTVSQRVTRQALSNELCRLFLNSV